MYRIKHYISIAACCILCLCFTACSAAANNPITELPDAFSHPATVAYGPKNGLTEADYLYGFAWGSISNYYEPMPGMFEKACEELGIPTPIDGTPLHWVQKEQDKKLAELLKQGVQGICMMPSDEEEGRNTINHLVADGIPVICIGGPPAQPCTNTLTLATDVYQCAYDATVILLEELQYEGNLIALTGAVTDTNSNKRLKGVADACAQYGNVTLLDQIIGISSLETSLEIVGDMLEEYGDQVDGVVAMDYYAAYAMAHYLIENKEYDGIVCVGLDSDPLVLQAISEGKMLGSMSQNPWAQAYLSVYTLKMLTDGWTYRDDQPVFVDTGSFLITREHVEDYELIAINLTMDMAKSWTDRFYQPPDARLRNGGIEK